MTALPPSALDNPDARIRDALEWVLQDRELQWSPEEVDAEVNKFRKAGVAKVSHLTDVTDVALRQEKVSEFLISSFLKKGLCKVPDDEKQKPKQDSLVWLFTHLSSDFSCLLFRFASSRSVVFSAYHRNRSVAIKCSTDCSSIYRESTILDQLKGISGVPERVSTICDASASRTALITAPFGQTLDSIVREGLAVSVTDIERWAKLCCVIIKAVHKRRVIHCDIKPQNIILAGTDIFIIDWGAAVDKGRPIHEFTELYAPRSARQGRISSCYDDTVGLLYTFYHLEQLVLDRTFTLTKANRPPIRTVQHSRIGKIVYHALRGCLKPRSSVERSASSSAPATEPASCHTSHSTNPDIKGFGYQPMDVDAHQ